jgi:hypothetical protein
MTQPSSGPAVMGLLWRGQMGQHESSPPPQALCGRSFAEGAAIVAAVAVSAVVWRGVLVNHDTAWFTLIAAQLIEGADYGSAFDDPNWPLAATLMIPAALLWRLGVDIATAIDLQVHAVALASLLACLSLYRRCLAAPWPLLAAVAAAELVLPGSGFSQREHFFTLLFLPYLALAGARLDGRPVGRLFAVTVGIAAAVAATIKPVFILAPCCVEAAMLLRRPHWSTSLRPETVAGLLAVAALATTVLVIHPHYVDTISGLVRHYDGYGTRPIMVAVTGILGALAAATVVLAWLGAPAVRGHVAVSAAAALAMLAVFALQMKGYTYQALPTAMVILVILGLAPPTSRSRAVLHGGVLAGLVWIVALMLWPPRAPSELAELTARFREAPPGPVSALMINPEPLSAATTVRRAWGNRANALYLLPGLIRAERAAAAAGRPLAAEDAAAAEALRVAAAEDLERFRPVLVVTLAGSQGPPPFDFDVIAWLSLSPRFRQAWAAYEEAGTAGRHTLYRRR